MPYDELKRSGSDCKGVANECILTKLKYFNLFDIMTVDVMHDLLEWVCQYEVKLFFKLLIQDDPKKLLTINHRISFFNYGLLDSENKPSLINLNKK